MHRPALVCTSLLVATLAASPPVVAAEEYQAVVVPRRAVQVAAEREGLLEEVHVVLGQRVPRGEPIATLESETLRLERASAAASLREAQGELTLAQISLEKARDRRQRVLTSPDAFSESERRDAEFDERLAEEQQRIAQTRIERHEVSLARLDELLRRSVVEAPFDGTVARVHRSAGAVVASGTPIVQLITADDLLVRFAVPPDVAAALRPAKRIRFVFGEPVTECDAVIEHIAAEIDPALEKVIVEAALRPPSSGRAADRAQPDAGRPPATTQPVTPRDAAQPPRPKVQPGQEGRVRIPVDGPN